VVLPLQKGRIYGVVNDLSGGPAPGRGIVETNYLNNGHSIQTDRFLIQLQPKDTLVLRGSRIRIRLDEWNDKAAKYTWLPSKQVSCQDCPEPLIHVPYTLRVSLEAANQYGCVSMDSILIRSINEDTLRLPNAFTPNYDGRNDIFYVIASNEVENVADLSIYNRYGERVFLRRDTPANDPVYGWDGYTGDGRPSPPGVYVYQVQLRFRDGSLKWYKGTITLIR
jgi:gliding motility-associated-like protein